MSKTLRTNYRRGTRGTRKSQRHIVVRSQPLNPPDLRKFSRAVIDVALREAETKAELRAAVKEGSGTSDTSTPPTATKANDRESSNA
jgi:hypothetical protein